jgi:hypothetical protein
MLDIPGWGSLLFQGSYDDNLVRLSPSQSEGQSIFWGGHPQIDSKLSSLGLYWNFFEIGECSNLWKGFDLSVSWKLENDCT